MWFSKVINLRLFLQTIYNTKVMKAGKVLSIFIGKMQMGFAEWKWIWKYFQQIFKISYNTLSL